MTEVSLNIPLRVENTTQGGWPKHLKARCRIQRAFDTWYRANQHRFLVKLAFIRRTDNYLAFAFQGIGRVIDATLSYEISVHVTWDDQGWDELISLDAYPKRVPGGYICTECDPATRPTFPSREALWEDHLFEPFLAWVNERLAPAQALHLYGSGGMTSAKLLNEGQFPDGG
jgi:hypothetical protein